MEIITEVDEVVILRTDFLNNSTWNEACEKIMAPHPEFGFTPNLYFISNPEYANINSFNVNSILPEDYDHEIIFIFDQATTEDKQNSILCVGLFDNEGKSFRVIPSEVWSVENNLSLANMEFDEFFEACEGGIFKGFE